jgi:peptide/nickel transport system ATP-binding protein
LAPKQQGKVELLGPIGEKQVLQGSKAFRRTVQMVFQDPYGSLHPRQTVDRILAEPLAIHQVADAETRIQRALDEVGLGTSFRFRFPHQLSGGQRQRKYYYSTNLRRLSMPLFKLKCSICWRTYADGEASHS